MFTRALSCAATPNLTRKEREDAQLFHIFHSRAGCLCLRTSYGAPAPTGRRLRTEMQSPILTPLKPPPPSERFKVSLHEPAKPTPPPKPAAKGAFGIAGLSITHAIERRTIRRAVGGAIFEGMFGGLCSMNVYVALKGMSGGFEQWEDAVSTLMQMLPSILMAFAMVYSSGGRVRKHRFYWVFAGVFGRLSVGVVALFTNPFLFVALVAFQSIVCAGISPALNHIWGANCTARTRGRAFIWYSTAAEIATMAGALIAGALLDGFHFTLPLAGEIHLNGNPRNYALLYPIAGVIGLVGMLYFWRVRLRYKPTHEDDEVVPPLFSRLAQAFKQARALLKRDPDFRLYEFGFFLYGTAFMMVAAVVPLFFKNTLDASYKEFSATTVVLVQVMHLVSVPLIVRFASGRRVTVVTRLPFAMLMLYPVLLGITALLAAQDRSLAMWFAYAAFVWFGIAMACIHFVWNLGPVAFAKDGNPLPYTSTHAALVGVRASVGFPMAYLFLWVFQGELLPVFIAATVLFFGASVVMTVLDRRLKAKGAMTNAMGH